MTTSSVLLAAGKGTRMNSNLPKVMHSLAGRPLILHALDTIKNISDQPPVIVIGPQSNDLQEVVGNAAQFVTQKERLGTGHALQQAKDLLSGKSDLLLVMAADMPFLTAETLQELVQTQGKNPGPVSLLTVTTEDPRGFGRILRNPKGHITAIIEELDAAAEQLEIKELNVGAYCFNADWLWENLNKIPLSAKGEYYLTDIIGLASKAGLEVSGLLLKDPIEGIGINTRVHLADAECMLRARINTEWMLAGVTLIDPPSTYIELDVEIGRDSVIYPNTYLKGSTRIGQNCIIGPNSIIRDTQIGDECEILASVLENATVEDNVDIGPFGHLRKGAHLDEGVHMGNFGEIKNSRVGQGSKVGHFSYIGDATIGKNVNIGAGTITVNYDGENKHHTEIGEGAFIGSDTMLIAPLKIGKGGRTGAGSVVTKNVAEGAMVVGVPARAIRRKKEKGDQ